MTQTESGKALEHALACGLVRRLRIALVVTADYKTGEDAFNAYSEAEQLKIRGAADAAVDFLLGFERNLHNGTGVYLQSDAQGRKGDPRDIVVRLPNGKDIGISAKNRHQAVKHSRLSDTIDFGKEWAECPCSPGYMKRVRPVFEDLRRKQQIGTLFRDIPDKINRYYLPVLMAFEDDLKTLCERHGQVFVTRLFHYLLGNHDFYKVVKDNGHVSVTSYNLNGDLTWGKRWKMPERIRDVHRARGSSTTLLVGFDGGWELSFRLHSASTICEPSLKFDINFTGMPPTVPRQEIDYSLPAIPI